jgi:hypothetical protein
MKWCFAWFALVALTGLCDARPGEHWTYEKLVTEADLVVIATPIKTEDKGKTVIPDLMQVGDDGKSVPIPAIGIETTFQVLAVLKGNKKHKEFVLYHLREAKPKNVPNGPRLVTFDPKAQRRYLLFLKSEANGRFIPVTGQVDAAVGVKDLGFDP